MSIPRELSRDTGDGLLISITPDVCLTPVGSTKVPIPYTITAKQADDANTCPTVRATGKRVHTMGSLITTCSGDEPGTAKGIKSGTVGSVCQPKGHSATVNAGGKPVIRHNDVWTMNNGNTVGKLTYVKDTSPAQFTPPVAAWKQQQQQMMAAAASSSLSDIAPGFPDHQSGPAVEVASAAQSLPAEPSPAPPPLKKPGQVIQGPWKQQPPTPPETEPMSHWARWFSRAGWVLNLLMLSGDTPLWQRYLSPYPQNDGEREIFGKAQDLLRPEDDEYDRQVGEWYHNEIMAQRKPVVDSPPQSGISPETARSTRDENKDREDCGIRPHSINSTLCGTTVPNGISHHGIADFTLRTGTRKTPGFTAPGAPSLDDALTVCVPSGEHTNLHKYVNSTINNLGKASGTDTLPFSEVEAISFEGIDDIDDEALSPFCKELYKQAVRTQFSAVPANLPLRGRLTPTELMMQNLSKAWGFPWP
ncbi:DUF4150 domain-containing protein [Martelella mangrovi]|uniref:Tox-PAAR-like domain-containing protein n=1 Tax=Martelella mangrovi TaxID=1397477 RepID=A0ABV2IG20_9HYPH